MIAENEYYRKRRDSDTSSDELIPISIDQIPDNDLLEKWAYYIEQADNCENELKKRGINVFNKKYVMIDFEEIRNTYPIPTAWLDEDFPQPHSWNSCSSPFREDHHSSFSIFDEGHKWMDHGTDESGDVFDFVCKAKNCDFGEAVEIIFKRLRLI